MSRPLAEALHRVLSRPTESDEEIPSGDGYALVAYRLAAAAYDHRKDASEAVPAIRLIHEILANHDPRVGAAYED